ncbi:MAG: C39 family peptidase [bacterium]|nr:C39 family peptidase [bacterium]
MNKEVVFIPKRLPDEIQSQRVFGAPSSEEYLKWVPEVCGICCLKSTGDTLGKTRHLSLYDLTMLSLEYGAFKISGDDTIEGIFHKPLLRLANSLGIGGEVRRSITEQNLMQAVASGNFVILSIELRKLKPDLSGSHLLLVYDFDATTSEFIVHDSAALLSETGESAHVPVALLNHLSNNKGLFLWEM